MNKTKSLFNSILLHILQTKNLKIKAAIFVFIVLPLIFLLTSIFYFYVTYSKEKILLPTEKFDYAKNNPEEFSDEELKGVSLAKYENVELGSVPQNCQNAIVAVEDKNFWNNNGVDVNGLVRGTVGAVIGQDYGGSTISMQLVKISQDSFYNRSITDKIKETVWAFRLNQSFTKEQILEKYLNNAYLGDYNYGVQSASRAYFGKNVEDLDLYECAYLMGIVQIPSLYSPTIGNVEAGRARQQVVLDLLTKANE